MKKSLAYNSAKKRKILLGTLIPLGCLVIATAIAVPVVLTQCSNSKKFKSFDKFYRYAESHIESPSEGMNFTNGDYLGNDGTDPRMLSWVASHINSKTALLMHAYGICRYTQGAANQKQTNITINLHNYTFEYSFTYKTDGTTDANTTGVCKYNAHILKTNDFQFTLSQSLDDGYSAPSSFDLNSNISLTYCANSKEFGLKLAVFSDGIDEFSYIFIPANCWTDVTFPNEHA